MAKLQQKTYFRTMLRPFYRPPADRRTKTSSLSTISSVMESIMEEPPSLERSEWSSLLGQLPLFPPAPHPPPALSPLLSPLLQQKLGLLSLGRGRGWPGTLTWLPHELSYKVNERLKSAWLAELEERFRGYRRFDDETVRSSNLKQSN
jgi:hypothetical protein